MLFKKHLIEKILSGRKTRTIRRTGRYKVGKVYPIHERPGGAVRGWILIKDKKPKKLGELTAEDVLPDGFDSLEGFVREWKSIYGSFDPEETVWLYDFELTRPEKARGQGT